MSKKAPAPLQLPATTEGPPQLPALPPSTTLDDLKLPVEYKAKFPPDVLKHALAVRGMNPMQWQAISEVVFPDAKSDRIKFLAWDYATAQSLDLITSKPFHVVTIYKDGEKVETIWPSIDMHRIKAHRTGEYQGCDEVKFGPLITKKFVWRDGNTNYEQEVTFPEWAQITGYRGKSFAERAPFVGPSVYWLEAMSSQKNTGPLSFIPNWKWIKKPMFYAEKCAEAAMLRKTFPEQCGSYTAEEMDGKHIAAESPILPDYQKPQAIAHQAQAIAQERATSEVVEGEVVETATGDILEATKRVAEQTGDTVTAEVVAEMQKPNKEQLTDLTKLCFRARVDAESRTALLKQYNVTEAKDLTIDQYHALVKTLEEKINQAK